MHYRMFKVESITLGLSKHFDGWLFGGCVRDGNFQGPRVVGHTLFCISFKCILQLALGPTPPLSH